MLTSPALSGNVQMRIDPTSVTWNDATGVMTVALTFQTANGNRTEVVAFGSEMYLTGADGAKFTPDTGLYGTSTATMVSLAGSAGYAWSTFNQPVISGTDPGAPGSGGVVFDQGSSTTPVAITSVAGGAVTAVYQFHYAGSHSTFTQVYAWVVSDDQGGPYEADDPTSWPYLNYDDGAAGDAVQITNEGVNLAPQPVMLSIMACPPTGGTITLSSSGPYTYGQVIIAIASAQPGYFFSGWTVTGSSTLSNSAMASTSLTVYDNFTLTADFAVRPTGDINGDGKVDGNDLNILNNRLNGIDISPYTDADCDLNGDGYVTTADRVLLRKILNGLVGP